MPEPTYSFAALKNRLTVRGVLVAQTGLRIGAGRDSEVTSNDLPVLRDALGRPFLPGASLKGVLRAQAEGLARALNTKAARDLDELEHHQRDVITPLKEKYQRARERGDTQWDEKLTRDILVESTLIDKTFGAPWLGGRLFVKDALVDKAYWFGQYEVRNGVGINRDTETAQSGFLYDYEVVPAGTRFEFELMLENAEEWQLGMVWLLLQPWQRGEIQVGGFRTRGLGYVQLEAFRATYSHIDSVDAVITLLQGQEEAIDKDDPRITQWTEALRDELTTLPAQTGAADV
jgi:CRISPR-associated RAMP protein (TIGR02581 family)